jgi:putative PEP-CTERM system integral membrane protein
MTVPMSRRLADAALKCAVGLFWCWNVVFICATLPLIPEVIGLLKAWWREDAPTDYVAILLAWIAVPWACLAWAWKRLRGRPQALALFFFAVEAPFFSLCLFRLVALRELTPAVGQWLAMLAAGWLILGMDALRRTPPRAAAWHALKLVGAICLILVAGYAGVLSMLVGLPVVLRAVWEVAHPWNWGRVFEAAQHNAAMFFFALAAPPLVLTTAASLLAMPPCMGVAAWRAGMRAWNGGPLRPAGRGAVLASALTLLAGHFAHLNHQPQQAVFARLADATKPMTPAEFEATQHTLRAGLLNAYLAPYRYASSEAESKGIAWMYEQLLGLPPAVAAWPQAAFHALARPLLYDGASMAADAARAAELYERYFDTPIQRGERTAIARALSATHDSDQRESGLLNIDQRKVRVAEQRVRVEPQGGGLARITLDETYVNLTAEPQEIFYLFSLPESAAITGLWLGNSPGAMLPHQLSPRGAAQRVYKAEVNRRIDPALLEQVGPRQYRLRAFPVPPRPRAGRDAPAADSTAGQRLYLRLQYTALANPQADGRRAWPLPVLGEKRNVAFDRQTRRSCDAGPCPSDGIHWWPMELPGPQPDAPAAHAFHLEATGQTVIARPVEAEAPSPRGKNILLVVDRSRSMAAHREALRAALHEARRAMAGNTVSVLLATTRAMGSQPPLLVPLDSLDEGLATTTMGGGPVGDLLRQAQQHAGGGHDLTLVLTDAGAFDLTAGQAGPGPHGGMLSFVHLGGALSPVYDDATLQAVQFSGGSSFTGLREAWRHFAQAQQAAPGFLMQRDGLGFSMVTDTRADTGTDAGAHTRADPQAGTGRRRAVDDPAFAAIATRLLIADAARHGSANGPAQLDALHALARAHGVVTPYSSMIVLVNDEQRRALEQAQQAADRFDRAHEAGTEQLPTPRNPLSVSATPEPEEWLMLLVSTCAVAWMLRARRRCGLVPAAAG